MTHEERPITFTISKTEVGYRMHTKDARVEENNRDVVFSENNLFNMMTFASGIYNNRGYAVLFEAD